MGSVTKSGDQISSRQGTEYRKSHCFLAPATGQAVVPLAERGNGRSSKFSGRAEWHRGAQLWTCRPQGTWEQSLWKCLEVLSNEIRAQKRDKVNTWDLQCRWAPARRSLVEEISTTQPSLLRDHGHRGNRTAGVREGRREGSQEEHCAWKWDTENGNGRWGRGAEKQFWELRRRQECLTLKGHYFHL